MGMQADFFAFSTDLMFGNVERDGIRYGKRLDLLWFMDMYLVWPPFLSMTDSDFDGVSLGVGPGLFLGRFQDTRSWRQKGSWRSDDIDELGLSLTAFASYKFLIGDVGMRIKHLFGSDFGTVMQFTYGLSW